jgi:hypothetical protein
MHRCIRHGVVVPALQRTFGCADITGMTRGTRRLLAVAGITTVAVCGAGGAAWALSHHHSDRTRVPTYVSARAMAQQAGCAATFHQLPLVVGVQSTGSCVVSGHLVDLRVQPHIDTADPWPATDGVRVPNFVGNGWIVHVRDVQILDTVGARLSG